jgi:two-component system chemotaxis response regulator CheY
MSQIYIICVDDQREVLTTVSRDLQALNKQIIIEECESADETLELAEEIDSNGGHLAVIISDHVMPGKSGVELLKEIHEDTRYTNTKKILLTGLATHQDTITAINQAGIDRYLEKPWNSTELLQNVKELLTSFILAAGLDYEKYIDILDQTTLLNDLKSRH